MTGRKLTIAALAGALLLAGCGGSSSSSSTSQSSTTTQSSATSSGSQIGFEGVPIEQGTALGSGRHYGNRQG